MLMHSFWTGSYAEIRGNKIIKKKRESQGIIPTIQPSRYTSTILFILQYVNAISVCVCFFPDFYPSHDDGDV